MKATFVNGAAELSHFKIGAAELRELEEMQVRGGWGWGVGGGWGRGSGWKKQRHSKNETEGMRRRSVGGGGGGVYGGKGIHTGGTAGEVDRGRNRKPGPSIG